MKYAIGTYTSMGGPGIAVIELVGNAMRLLFTDNGLSQDPIWIEQNPQKKNILYAACSDEKTEYGRIESFLLSENGLKRQSSAATNGLACCHLALSEAGDCLYTANYVDGVVTAHHIGEDGSIQPAFQRQQLVGSGPNKERQERAHAHQITYRPESDQVFVCDLGSDAVLIYQYGMDGTLTLVQRISCTAGIGPRHLMFDGPDRFYLVGELGGWIACYQQENGDWKLMQLLPTVPEQAKHCNTAAAIRMEGDRVYVSNRGYDSIAVFRKDACGLLTQEQLVMVPGAFPRDFQLLPDAFLIACQNSGQVLLTDRNGSVISALELPGSVSICQLK